ncbi:MAG: LacI family DNA-binding transcriptional regulator [Actinomycetes bacterium]
MTTITDVATAAGVSPATVSRVLNHPDLVAPSKRARVRAVIEELEYAPNQLARGLRRGTADTLALLVGDIAQPFHGRLAKAVEWAAERAGFSVLIYDLDHRHDRLLGFLKDLPNRGIGGFILATADNIDVPSVRSTLEALHREGVLGVSTSQHIRSVDIPVVSADQVAIGREATTHLADVHGWPIAFLGGGPNSVLSTSLRRGYLGACQESGHPAPRELLMSGDFQFESGSRLIGALLDGGHIPRGLVVANAPMAFGAIRAARQRGIHIPEDMVLISCEDVPMASYLHPTLTSVSVDDQEHGHRAFDVLSSLLAGHEVPRVTTVPYGVVIRDSSTFELATSPVIR